MTTPTPAPAGVPLWSEDRIKQAVYEEGFDYDHLTRVKFKKQVIQADLAIELLMTMAAEYEAELAKLRAQLEAPAGVPWTDERIRSEFGSDAYGAPSSNQMMREQYHDADGLVVDLEETISTAIRMRDDMQATITRLEAENAELRRQLAEQWTPVDDDWSYNSEEHLSLRVTHGGGTLRATDFAVYGSPVPLVNDHHLPDHIRLCSKPKEQAE